MDGIFGRDRLLKLDDEFKKASTILFYISYDNEVYTHDIIREYISVKNVILPVTDVQKKIWFYPNLKTGIT